LTSPLPSRRTAAAWIVSLGITVAIFAWLFSQVSPREILAAARRLRPELLVAYVALMLTGVVVRALRFWFLLRGAVPVRLLLPITLARNLFIDLLPARLGELSYVYLVVRKGGRTLEEAMASLVLTVLLDVLALGPLLLAALVVLGRDAGSDVPVRVLFVLSLLLAGIAYVTLVAIEPIGRLLARWLARRKGREWRQRAAGSLERLADSVARGRAAGAILPAFGLSLLVRLCKFGSYYLLVLAVLMPLGYSAEAVGFFRVFLGTLAAELAAALPVHGIGGFGSFELAWAFSFTQLGFAREDAIASGVIAHAISQVLEYSMGSLALLWLSRATLDHPNARRRAAAD
jgi:uncharacterized protein (TIRG00374 family)